MFTQTKADRKLKWTERLSLKNDRVKFYDLRYSMEWNLSNSWQRRKYRSTFSIFIKNSDRRSLSAKLTRTLGRRRRYTPSHTYTHIYIYRYRVSRVARWITTTGPTDLATALKSGLIYYYVLLLLFGYLYPYNIMPREIPRSRRYVTARLPRDRDLIFRIGHNLGQSCYVEYYLSPQLFHGPSKITHASYQ